MITSVDFSIISLMIFAVGIFGILFNKKNLLIMLMSIEIILLGANMNFVGFAALSGEPEGIIYSLLILTVAAAEGASQCRGFVRLPKKAAKMENAGSSWN